MFFKKTNDSKLRKSVAVYISKIYGQIIICPRYQNNAGIIYEQETCSLFAISLDYSTLSGEILRNFHLYSIKDKNLRDQKRTDWPAFKCSRLKSVKSFEASFLLIEIFGNNESNIILSIEASFVGHENMFITSTISSTPANERAIAERVMQVYNTAVGDKF